MSPTRFRECLNMLGWTQRGLASILDRQEGAVRQWARGVVEIPDEVAAWLETRAEHTERCPPPFRVHQ